VIFPALRDCVCRRRRQTPSQPENNNPKQPQQLQPQQPTITITSSIYDDIGDYYDELIDLDKETDDYYHHPGAGSGRATPNLYQRLGDEAMHPVSSTIDDDKSSGCGEYADLDKKAHDNYDQPDDVPGNPGDAAADSYQRLDPGAIKPVSSTASLDYLDLIDDEMKKSDV